MDPHGEHKRRPLSEHMADYKADLQSLGRAPTYIATTASRLTSLADACGWRTLSDVEPNSLLRWRAKAKKDGLAPKTINQYVAAAKALLNWCVQTQRIATSPLALIGPLDESTDVRRVRRAPTVAELKRLLSVSGQRALVYLTAAHTGLRRSELKHLEWGDIHFDDDPPCLTLRAEATKARRADTVPLRADLAELLRQARPPFAQPTHRVFRSVPTIQTFRNDLKRAGIKYKDAQGRQLDLHALRMAFNTMLAKAGVSPREAMELMRHRDLKLTTNVYTDPRLFDLSEAVESLPSLLEPDPSGQAAKATGTDDERPLVGALVGALAGNAYSNRQPPSSTDTDIVKDDQVSNPGKSRRDGRLDPKRHALSSSDVMPGTGFEPARGLTLTRLST